MDATLQDLRLAPALTRRLAAELADRRYAFAGGVSLQAACALPAAVWHDFADAWNRLTLDRYMGDGGCYRYRRYGEFELASPDGALTRLPHGPYRQPSYINPLNGGVDRHFDPLEDGFVANPLFDGLLRSLAAVFDQAQGWSGPWNIRLHPYRIRADGATPGLPTPEGLHRDGVDFIVTLLVARRNVEGGETTVTDADGQLLHRHTLTHPLDLLLADDARTMHAVSPVLRREPEQEAWRDVLVVAYTRPLTRRDA